MNKKENQRNIGFIKDLAGKKKRLPSCSKDLGVISEEVLGSIPKSSKVLLDFSSGFCQYLSLDFFPG